MSWNEKNKSLDAMNEQGFTLNVEGHDVPGVYWKPIYNILEGGVELLLVNAQHIKAAPGRKTDVKGCEWIAAVPRRMPDLRLASADLDWGDNPTFRGLKSLPVALSRRG